MTSIRADYYEAYSKEELLVECRRLASELENSKKHNKRFSDDDDINEDDVDDDDDDDFVDGNDPWSLKYQELKLYKQKHGDCKVPKATGSLGSWCDNQRTHYGKFLAKKKTAMNQDRVDKLNTIGFYFGKKYGEPKTWDDWALELQERVDAFGVHPKTIAIDTDLGKWILSQRKEYKRLKKGKPSSLSMDQAKRLKSLGF